MSLAAIHASVRACPGFLRWCALACGALAWALTAVALLGSQRPEDTMFFTVMQLAAGLPIAVTLALGSRLMVDVARRRLMPDGLGRQLGGALTLVAMLQLLPCVLMALGRGIDPGCGMLLAACVALAAWWAGWCLLDLVRQFALHPRRTNAISYAVIGVLVWLSFIDCPSIFEAWSRHHPVALQAALGAAALVLVRLSYQAIRRAQGAVDDQAVVVPAATQDAEPIAAATVGSRRGPGPTVQHRLVTRFDWIRHCAAGWLQLHHMLTQIAVQSAAVVLLVWMLPHGGTHLGIEMIVDLMVLLQATSIMSCIEMHALMRQESMRPISRAGMAWLVHGVLGYVFGIRVASQLLVTVALLAILKPAWVPLALPMLILVLATAPLAIALLGLATSVRSPTQSRLALLGLWFCTSIGAALVMQATHWMGAPVLQAVAPCVLALGALALAWSVRRWRRIDLR